MKNIVRSIKMIYKICPVLVVLLGLFTILFTFISPLYSVVDKFLFDFLQSSYNEGLDNKRILYIVLLYFTYNLTMYILIRVRDMINVYSQTRISSSLQIKAMKKISCMKYDCFEDNNYYNYINTVQNEINSGKLLQIYSNLITLISIFITIGFLSFLLLGLGIGAVVLSIFCCIPGFLHQATFGKKNWEFNTSKIPLHRKTGYFFSLITDIKTFGENRVYNTIPYYKDKYTVLFDEYYHELKNFNKTNCWKGIVMSTFHSLGTVAVIAYAYYQAANGNITLGDAVLFVGVCQSVYNNVQNAIYTMGSINEAKHSVNNLLDFVSDGEESVSSCVKDEKWNNNLDKFELELSDIVYTYPGTEKRVLDGLSLKIKDGEKLAIVGENGSGKTTLAKIILGLYYPQSGTISVNGFAVTTLFEMERYASVCFQDYYTYALSLRENVGLGNIIKVANDDEICNAIDMSGLNTSMRNMNLDAQITKMFDSEGVELSKGQSQKLSLAKAFLFNKGMLVLDEPSAALDIITENEIFQTTLKLMSDRTSVVITHRLSNVIHCDRIVYIESGKIIEEGTHKELMELNGKYAELFAIQAKNFVS